MGDKPSLQGFLKGLLGRGKPDTPPVPTDSPAAPAPDPPKAAPHRSQAYHQRKKGRKLYKDASVDLERIAACLHQKAEVTPGEMARQLGMARSTLAYNLNRMIQACQNSKLPKWKQNYRLRDPAYIQDRLFKGKRLEKLGGGKYVRYRLVEDPPQAPEAQ